MIATPIDVWNVATFDQGINERLRGASDLIRKYFETDRRQQRERTLSHHCGPPPSNPFAAGFLKFQEELSAQIADRTIRAWHYTRLMDDEADAIIVRQNWLRAYDFVTDRAATTLNEYAQSSDPFADVGRKSRTVDVVSVVRVSDDSFQARWIEKTYENGALVSAQRFTGNFTIITQPPTDAETLRANPLGLYVHALNWGQDLVTGE